MQLDADRPRRSAEIARDLLRRLALSQVREQNLAIERGQAIDRARQSIRQLLRLELLGRLRHDARHEALGLDRSRVAPALEAVKYVSTTGVLFLVDGIRIERVQSGAGIPAGARLASLDGCLASLAALDGSYIDA